MVAQDNLLEEGILEHATMRRTLAALGIAEVFVAPPRDVPFDFHQGAGERFDAMLRALAAESGYAELSSAPVIPLGHSACATFPWNFAAWAPSRTLAVLSIKGDAPRTKLTGYGAANIAWEDRDIDGVPGLMVMAEYEWLEERLAPAIAYRYARPLAPIAMLAEPGRGHFDASDELVGYLAMFVRKAAEARLPAASGATGRPEARASLIPINPRLGWLVQRWTPDQLRSIPAAPAREFRGKPGEAFWCFDREMALATQDFRADQIGKQPQLLAFVQDGAPVPQTDSHAQVQLRFHPQEDGVTFQLGATFLETVAPGAPNLVRWTGRPAGTRLGHATGGGAIRLSRVTGPVVQTGPQTFRIALNRLWSTGDRRRGDIWLLAEHPGDATYKSAVQQAHLRLEPNRAGAAQTITFAPIADQPATLKSLSLRASSSAGPAAKVRFYVREGPAEVDGDTLHFTALPPRAKFPLKVTVVAWQLGRATDPKLQSAPLVEQTFVLRPCTASLFP
ncbi:hypothetical protein DB354_10385 [Opitutus sp. ER46]|nr:hypothetical protein DB354_10385 [Opitutus sp. ER46]